MVVSLPGRNDRPCEVIAQNDDGTFDLSYTRDHSICARGVSSDSMSHFSPGNFPTGETTLLMGRLPRERKAPKKYTPIMSKKSTVSRVRTHEDFCFCCNQGGELLECGACPKVYHLSCVALQKVPQGMWNCSWHSCIVCDRTSTNSGGMQLRCCFCPITHCFDCWPADQKINRIDAPRELKKTFLSNGFKLTENAIWVVCRECKERRSDAEKIRKEENRIKSMQHLANYVNIDDDQARKDNEDAVDDEEVMILEKKHG